MDNTGNELKATIVNVNNVDLGTGVTATLSYNGTLISLETIEEPT